jgi:Fur family ferric uptake transcriptional regulator
VDVDRGEMAHALREAGHRLTQPRLAVLQVLQDSDAGLNPDEIHRQGKVICGSLGLVTVYRTLDLLAELGLVRRVHSEQHCQRYARAGTNRHYLVCGGCHRVVEFPCAGLEGLIDRVGAETGYTIQDHLLELSGLCPDCQAESIR